MCASLIPAHFVLHNCEGYRHLEIQFLAPIRSGRQRLVSKGHSLVPTSCPGLGSFSCVVRVRVLLKLRASSATAVTSFKGLVCCACCPPSMLETQGLPACQPGMRRRIPENHVAQGCCPFRVFSPSMLVDDLSVSPG